MSETCFYRTPDHHSPFTFPVRDGMMILDGVTKEQANERFWCIDRNGLLVDSMGNALRHSQLPYARHDEETASWTLDSEDRKGIYLMDGELVEVAATYHQLMRRVDSRTQRQTDRLDWYFYPRPSIHRRHYQGNGQSCGEADYCEQKRCVPISHPLTIRLV